MYSISKCGYFSVSVLIVSAGTNTVGTAQQSSAPETPVETIAYFASLRHGLIERMMDDETKALLDRVVSNPTVYANAIKDAMKLPTDESVDDRTYKFVGTALGLAKRMSGDVFGQQVSDCVVKATDRLRKDRMIIKPQTPIEGEVKDNYQRMLLLRSAAIDILGDYGIPDAVEIW